MVVTFIGFAAYIMYRCKADKKAMKEAVEKVEKVRELLTPQQFAVWEELNNRLGMELPPNFDMDITLYRSSWIECLQSMEVPTPYIVMKKVNMNTRSSVPDYSSKDHRDVNREVFIAIIKRIEIYYGSNAWSPSGPATNNSAMPLAQPPSYGGQNEMMYNGMSNAQPPAPAYPTTNTFPDLSNH